MSNTLRVSLIYANAVGARVGKDYMNAGSFSGFISVYTNLFVLKGMLFRKYSFEPGDIQGGELNYVFGNKKV